MPLGALPAGLATTAAPAAGGGLLGLLGGPVGIGLSLASALGPSLFGRGVGDPAPAFNPGQAPGLLGEAPAQAIPETSPMGGVTELLQQFQQSQAPTEPGNPLAIEPDNGGLREFFGLLGGK